MGTNLADKLDNMELITGNRGILQFTQIADLRDHTGHLVVILNGSANCFIRDIYIVDLGKRLGSIPR